VKLQVNGEERELPEGATIADLVESLGLRPEIVAVEVERELVSRKEHATRRLTEGERVEVVTLVGGG
jgi:sulfur carrier protein